MTLGQRPQMVRCGLVLRDEDVEVGHRVAATRVMELAREAYERGLTHPALVPVEEQTKAGRQFTPQRWNAMPS